MAKTLKDIYQKAVDSKVLSSKISEDQFADILKDDNKRKEYYDYCQENFPNFYSNDYEVFSNNAKNLLSSTNPSVISSPAPTTAKEDSINLAKQNEGEQKFNVVTPTVGQTAQPTDYNAMTLGDLQQVRNEQLRKAQANKERRISEQKLWEQEHPFLASVAAMRGGGAYTDKSVGETLKEVDADLFADDSKEQNAVKEALGRKLYESNYNNIGSEVEKMQGVVGSISRDDKKLGERKDLDKAEYVLDQAHRLATAPSKYDPSTKGIANFGEGIADNTNRDLIPAVELIRDININNAIKKMNDGKELTEGERALILSYITYSDVQQARQYDLPMGYQAGAAAAESIPFMAEMLLTKGASKFAVSQVIRIMKAAGKTADQINDFAKWMNLGAKGIKVDDVVYGAVEEGAKNTLGDIARNTASELVGTTLQTAAMPSTYQGMIEDNMRTRLATGENDIEGYHMNNLRNFGNAWVQTLTERKGGELIDWGLGKIMPFDKIWHSKAGNQMVANQFFQSPVAETLEEYLAAVINYGRSFNPLYSEESNAELKQEAEDMFTAEGLGTTFLSMLPNTILGGAVNLYDVHKTTKDYNNARTKVLNELVKSGATEEQAENILMQIETSDKEEMQEKFGILYSHFNIENQGGVGAKAAEEYIKAAQAYQFSVADLANKFADLTPEEQAQAQQEMQSFTSQVKQKAVEHNARMMAQTQAGEATNEDGNIYQVTRVDGTTPEGSRMYISAGNVVTTDNGKGQQIIDRTQSSKDVFVTTYDADGNANVEHVSIDELDLMFDPTSRQQVEDELYDMYMQEYAIAQQMAAQQAAQAQGQVVGEDNGQQPLGATEGEQGRNIEGRQFTNGQQTITASNPDSNGNVTLSAPITLPNGTVSEQVLPQQVFDGLMSGLMQEEGWQEVTSAPQAQGQTQGQQTTQPISWGDLNAEQATATVVERSKGDKERAKKFAQKQVEVKTKALQEAQAEMDAFEGDDLDAFNAAQDKVDAAQAEVDKWTAVANGIDAYNAPTQVAPQPTPSATSASGNGVVTEAAEDKQIIVNTAETALSELNKINTNGKIAQKADKLRRRLAQVKASSTATADDARALLGEVQELIDLSENSEAVWTAFGNAQAAQSSRQSASNPQQSANNSQNTLQNENNSVPLQEKKRKRAQEIIDKIQGGNNTVYLFDMNDIIKVLEDAGVSQISIGNVKKQIAQMREGDVIGGFQIGNKIFINYDQDENEIRRKYVHERQHILTTAQLANKIASSMSWNELFDVVCNLCGSKAYQDRDAIDLANELISFSMEWVYEYDNNQIVRGVLKKYGLNEEQILTLINLGNEQRKDNTLSRARRTAYVNNSRQESGRQDGRDISENPTRDMEGQGVRPSITSESRTGRPSEVGQDTALEESGIQVNDETGDARFSVNYRLDANQMDILAEQIAERVGVSKAKAKKWLKAETSLAALCMQEDNVDALYYFADGRYGAIKNNSDYPQGTVDFNNICRKRLDFTNIYLSLQREFPNKVFTAKDLETIRQIMIEDGLEVACGLCYVEDRRQLLGEIANEFRGFLKDRVIPEDLSATKKEVMQKVLDMVGDDTYIPTIAQLLEAGAYELRNSHPSIFEAFVVFNNSRGMQSGRLFEGYAEYKREILDWSDKKVKQVNDAGGLRIFSFSDFEAHHLIDIVQIISDAASKGVMIQGYTKVPEFARAIRNTKVKLNRSLIPLGDTGIQEVDGNKVLAYDTTEGIDVNSENFLDESNNPNVGNVLVGINDEQIRMAMDDTNVDYIIPFHTGLKKDILLQKKIGAWVNYKNSQTEKDATTGSSKTADGKKVVGVNIYTDVLQSAEKDGTPIKNRKEFVEYFLKVCKERGLVPRFEQFLARGKNGEYKYTKGYEKLLVDFKMFDKRGNILPQEPVVPIFDDAFNQQIIEDYVKGTKETKEYESTKEKIKENLQLNDYTDDLAESESQVRYSIVTDKKKIEELEASEKIIGYRNVVLNEDGTFGSPMASSLQGEGKKVKTQGFELNKWEQAEENPDLADENGKIDLVKPDGKNIRKVDYNPYIHNRPNKVNKQFKQAWERPNLVYIETEIAKTDLDEGYHAEKAKKSVGIHKWNGGKLILSRYDKPIRIVPWEEVADDWVKAFKKRGVEFDIVPPALLPILHERGVEILPPHKNMGDACVAAYEQWKAENSKLRFSISSIAEDVWNKYQYDGELESIRDVANYIEENMPKNEQTQALFDAIDAYNEEEFEDREYYGMRGDLEPFADAILDEIESLMNNTPRFSITAEEDKAYADAVARGDMETAQDMLRDAAERAGYAPLGDYKDMHQAPSATVEKEDFTNIEALQEQLDNGNVDSNLFAIAQGVTAAPQDYFSPQGARWYGYGNLSGMESYSAINNAIRSINAQLREYGEVRDMPKVKVYRAVPKNIKGAQLESEGQWVSPSREYAVGHGRHRFGFNQYRIIEQEVPADQLWWDANDIREWGFDDGTVNAYQNTKNNRKLYEVTYDDNGELIPLSKRFDKRKADVRFSVTAQEDAAYMDAVNRGDMETAQRMVNETAKKAGYAIRAYHGTKDKFNEFKYNRGNKYDSGYLGRGYYFTDDKDTAEDYSKWKSGYDGEIVMSVALNLENPLVIRDTADTNLIAVQKALGLKLTDFKDSLARANSRVSNAISEEAQRQGYDGIVRHSSFYNATTYVVFYPNQIKSADPVTYDDNGDVIPLSERFNNDKSDIRFSIIGERGAANLDRAEEATTRLDNLAVAREMESANKDAKTIKMATGWERGADGKWRYEIEDIKLKDTNILNTNESVTLGDIVEDNVLFTAYPDMKDIVVDKNVSNGDLAKYNGNIGLSAELLDMPSSAIRTALIHEIQHAIQEREGFAGGVPSPNAKYFVKRKAELEKAINALENDFTIEQLRELAKITDDADLRGVYVDALIQMAEGATMDDVREVYTNEYNGLTEQERQSTKEYVNAAGEVESRNASSRLGMSAKERRETLLSETEDVAREDQLFIYDAIENANRDIRFSLSNNNQRIFVSNAERAVESIKQEKATPQQWKAMIEKQGGLKAGEDKWLGLSEWLDSKVAPAQENETMGEVARRVAKNTIAKQEILDYIAEHQIQIEEVEYGEYDMQDVFEGYRSEYKQYYDEAVADNAEDPQEDAWQRMIEEHGEDFSMGFYAYGDELQWDTNSDYIKWELENSSESGLLPINDTRMRYTTEGLENKQEIALTVPTIESWNEGDEVHFGDAGNGRAIAWVRFGETQMETPRGVIDHVDELQFAYTNVSGRDVYAPQGSKFSKDYAVYGKLANGEMGYVLYVRDKQLSAHPTLEAALDALNAHYEANPRQVTEYSDVLVIDEIQSKRHQEGREKGYATKKDRDIKKKIAELTDQQDAIFDAMRAREEGRAGITNFTEEETAELKRLGEEIKQLQSELSANNGIIPDAPFDKNWHELAFKRMLRYAAENGYDYVAWTTGEQQAERYNLGKQFDSIEREDNPSINGRRFALNGANYFTFVVNEEGVITESDMSEIQGKPLADVVGKDLAIRMMLLEDGDAIEGADLRIGGEGMKGFYDKILPSFVSKYTKKWGAKVQDINLPNLEESAQTMHAVNVTQEMKDSVMEGQVMFSVRNTAEDLRMSEENATFAEQYRWGDTLLDEDYISEAYDKEMDAFYDALYTVENPLTEAERNKAMQAKAKAIEEFLLKLNYNTPNLHVISSLENMQDELENAGVQQDVIDALIEEEEALREKKKMSWGMKVFDGVYIFAEPMQSLTEVQLTFAHEMQHIENERNKKLLADIVDVTSPQELNNILIALGTSEYSHYLNEKENGFIALADEVVAYMMEYGFALGKDGNLAEALKRDGLENTELINLLQQEYERRKEDTPFVLVKNQRSNKKHSNNTVGTRNDGSNLQGRSNKVARPKFGGFATGSMPQTRGELARRVAEQQRLQKLRDDAVSKLLSTTEVDVPDINLDEDFGIRFSVTNAPAPTPDETKGEYLKRYMEWRESQVNENAVNAYKEELKKGTKFWRTFVKKIVDRNIAIEKFQEFVLKMSKGLDLEGKISINTNAFLDVAMAAGRAHSANERFKTRYQIPMMDAIKAIVKSKKLDHIDIRWNGIEGKKNGKRLTASELVGIYCQAKDVQEAIEMDLPDRGQQGFKDNLLMDGNEVSHKDVIRIVEDALAGTNLKDNLWKAVNQATLFSLIYQRRHRFISRKTFDEYKSRKYYVPERGWRERDLEDRERKYVDDKGNEGRMDSPFNVALKKAEGRSSLASDPFAYIVSIAKSTIAAVEKNRVKQKFLQFLFDNDQVGLNTKAWTIKQVYLVEVKNKDGEKIGTVATYEKPSNPDDIAGKVANDLESLKQLAQNQKNQHAVVVVKDGEEYVIWLEDEQLANALNRNYAGVNFQNSRLGRGLKGATGYYSGQLTQYNPEFAVSNFVRDYILSQMSNFAVQDKPFEHFAKFNYNLARIMPALVTYVGAHTIGREVFLNTKKGKYMQEYFALGAQTGFSYLEDVSVLRDLIDKWVNKNDIVKYASAVPKFVFMDMLSALTELSELSIRMTQYITCREMGMKQREAAIEAKEITVNFDRKGELAGVFGCLWSFFNASVQGTNKIARDIKRKPLRATLTYAGFAGLLFYLGYLLTNLFPDDPEEEEFWNEYVRRTNITVGEYKIPMAHFFRIFWGGGVTMALKEQGRLTETQAAGEMTRMVFDEIIPQSPFQVQNLFEYNNDADSYDISLEGYERGLIPSVLMPIYDVKQNEDFLGRKISKEPYIKSEEGKYKAKKYERANSTNEKYIKAADWLSGGDPKVLTKGVDDGNPIDINGTELQYIVEGYTKQFATLVDTYNLVTKAIKEKEIQTKDIPFLRKFKKDYMNESAYKQEYWTLYNYIDQYKSQRKEVGEDANPKKEAIYDNIRYRKLLNDKPNDNDKHTPQEVRELMELNKQWRELLDED